MRTHILIVDSLLIHDKDKSLLLFKSFLISLSNAFFLLVYIGLSYFLSDISLNINLDAIVNKLF